MKLRHMGWYCWYFLIHNSFYWVYGYTSARLVYLVYYTILVYYTSGKDWCTLCSAVKFDITKLTSLSIQDYGLNFLHKAQQTGTL